MRPIMKLYAPMAKEVADKFLYPAIELMETFGFRWWLSTDELPDIMLMIESPKVWVERGPSQRELDHFFKLYEEGRQREAHEFAQKGFPEYLR